MALKDYHEILKKFQTQIDLGWPHAMCDLWLRVELWNKQTLEYICCQNISPNESKLYWLILWQLSWQRSVLPPITFAFQKVSFVSYDREEQFPVGEMSRNRSLHTTASSKYCTGSKCLTSPNWPEWRRNGQRLDKAKDIFRTTRLKNEKSSCHKPLLWSSLLTLNIHESYQIPQLNVTESF